MNFISIIKLYGDGNLHCTLCRINLNFADDAFSETKFLFLATQFHLHHYYLYAQLRMQMNLIPLTKRTEAIFNLYKD